MNDKDLELLDMFAACTLSGIIKDEIDQGITIHKEDCIERAEFSYEQASAMLVVRSKVRESIETLWDYWEDI